ncbi:MAG: zinc metalloprotease HtpX [Desulfatibacillaceae bacterium]|nr:zinc metalloprotease HtpX [Desulfatibacillaceae bacterium]
MTNSLKTVFLLGLLTVLLVLIGGAIGGRGGMIVALVFAGVMNFVSYWHSDKIVLKMYKAREVSANDAPMLYGLVKSIAMRASLPMPKVYIIPQNSPNAFATGRNPENAAVAVTQGLLQILDKEELEGVIAHEMAHVGNRDILIGTIAATLAGAITLIATWARWAAIFGRGGDSRGNIFGLIAMSILAPIAAMLVQMAVSRSREYHADATGAAYSGNPVGLAKALDKLQQYSKRAPMQANPATAHMFIVSPLSASSLGGLFSTHPPMDKRIERLVGQRPSSPQGPDSRGPQDRERGLNKAKNVWDNLK